MILTFYYTCSLLSLERLFCFTQQTQFDRQHDGVYLLIADGELMTSLHLVYWTRQIRLSGYIQ